MPEYQLEEEAEKDLLEIGRYTARRWGLEQAERYLSILEQHFQLICSDSTHVRQFVEHRDDIFFSRCQHHYIFFARGKDSGVLILAVFHKNMNLMSRLKDRMKEK